jgi:outer membrane protein assembly factor BamB
VAGAQLGSLDFQPSAERPVGWRGDWTGRFPGATPPVEWTRRVKGITTEIRYQADKPAKAVAGTDSHPLEYFTIKEWLVAGPFDAADPAKDIDEDFLGSEGKVMPAKGDKAGTTTWKHVRADIATQSSHYHNEGTCGDLNVDFVYCFGNLPESGTVKVGDLPLNNKVAYAHTYIYSPAAAQVRLRVNYRAAAVRVFLNGQPVAIPPQGQEVNVTLAQGWNRLLLKAASADAAAPEGQNVWVSRWRIAAYLEPVLPVAYETKNVAWMTRMTGRSMSQPVVVGDRIYVGSDMTDLLCLDKTTGKILWLQSNTPYDAMTPAQKAEPQIKEKVVPLVAKLAVLNGQAVTAINAMVSPSGMSSDQQAKLDVLLKAKSDAEKAVHDAFRDINRKKYPPMYGNEVSASNSVPASDGKHIYWACGGGMKGPGSHVIACFDPAGKRVWSWHDGGSLGSLEHGNHMSPTLVDGKLIYSANMKLVAFDAATGKELWRNAPDDWQNAGHGCNSPVVVKIGGQSAIVQLRYVHRASDGTVICPSKLEIWGCSTPIIENGVVFNPCSWHGFKDPLSFMAVKLPATAAAGSKVEILMDLDGRDVTMPLRMPGPVFTVASPLYVDGVVYSAEAGGGLAAVDTVTRKALYRQHLDGYNRYHRFLYGIAASPTLAGKNIYIVDDAGFTHIIPPGGPFKDGGRNVIENIHLSGHGGNPCKQESFYTSPWFEGKCMYLRGEEYLYCIQQK